VLPAPVFAPHPLPAWAPGSVTPPILIKPATPKEASNLFRSFFSMVASPENWFNNYRKNLLLFIKLSSFSIMQFQDCQQNGKKETEYRQDKNRE
jgi:hypothetical protein